MNTTPEPTRFTLGAEKETFYFIEKVEREKGDGGHFKGVMCAAVSFRRRVVFALTGTCGGPEGEEELLIANR